MSEPLIEDRVVSSHELKKELDETPARSFFSTGFPFLDQLVGAVEKGDLVVIGGNPGSGKTTLMQTLTRNFANANVPCLWFSIELTAKEFLERFGDKLPVFYLPRRLPDATTHLWIEQKILEAKEKYGVQVVFIDDLGMIIDESVARHQNNVDIFDARVMRLKRFAVEHEIAIVAVSPLVQQQLRAKKVEPSEGNFRGTAMIAYRANTCLIIEKLAGQTKFSTVNEDFPSLDDFKSNFLANQDSYLYIVKSRRTGVRKQRIKLFMDKDGNLKEA